MTITIPRLYAILDAAQLGGRSPVAVMGSLLRTGVRLIQYRDKTGSSLELYLAGRDLAGNTRGSGAIFVVNDRADIARAVDADGVHVGREDLPVDAVRGLLQNKKLVGCSTHTLAQVREADRTSADYIAFGPVFPTQSKEAPDAVVGLEGLAEARRSTAKPLVAIGGITLQNARAVIEAGADSVAVIGGLLRAPDIGVRAREFLAALS